MAVLVLAGLLVVVPAGVGAQSSGGVLSLAVFESSVVEGDSGYTDVAVTVSAPSSSGSHIWYSLCFGGSAGLDEGRTLTASEDYRAVFPGGVVADDPTHWGSGPTAGCIGGLGENRMSPGSSRTYWVRVLGDSVAESDESVTVSLRPVASRPLPSDVSIAPVSSVTVSVIDDDSGGGSSESVLVSNGPGSVSGFGGSGMEWVTPFTTGAGSGGWRVSSVDVRLGRAAGRSASVAIREKNGANPGAVVARLTAPAGGLVSYAVNRFSVPAGTVLDGGREYFLVFNDGQASRPVWVNPHVSWTESNAESGVAGWSIGDGSRWRTGGGGWRSNEVSVRFAVNGVRAAPSVADCATAGWDGAFRVPADWPLTPEGLAAGDRFRLLFVTSGTRDATSADIGVYNGFVQTAARAGHPVLGDGCADRFAVVGSTATVAATVNTRTRSSDTDASIWWFGGDKAADDYADFYDGSWDSTSGRDESGGVASNYLFHSGSVADGTGALSSGNVLGGAVPAYGDTRRGTISFGPGPAADSEAFLGLSPVLEVAPQRSAGAGRAVVSVPASVTEGGDLSVSVTLSGAASADAVFHVSVRGCGEGLGEAAACAHAAPGVAYGSVSDFGKAVYHGDPAATYHFAGVAYVHIPAGRLSGSVSIPVAGGDGSEPAEAVAVQVTPFGHAGIGHVAREFLGAGTSAGMSLWPAGSTPPDGLRSAVYPLWVTQITASSQQQTAAPPTVTISTTATQVTEGGDVTFTVTADPAPLADVTVTVEADETMGEGLNQVAGASRATVVVGAGQTTAQWVHTAMSDEVERADGTLVARVVAGTGYTLGDPAATAAIALIDDDSDSDSVGGLTRSGLTDSDSGSDGGPDWSDYETVVAYLVGVRDDPPNTAVKGHPAHILKWNRVLAAIGHPSGEEPMDEAEIHANADRWPHSPFAAASAYLDSLQAASTVTVTAGAGVTEGGDASFTLTAAPAPAAGLDVTVAVSQSGDWAATTGTRTVTIPASGTVTFAVATADDDTDEADGTITATVVDGDGYDVGSASTATVTVADDDDPPPPTPQISISGGSDVTEGSPAQFTLTATPAPSADLDVGVTVTADGDWGATVGKRTVTVPASGTATFAVATADDDTDEPDGTITAAVDMRSGWTVSPSQGTAAVAVSDNDDTHSDSDDNDNSDSDGDPPPGLPDCGPDLPKLSISSPTASRSDRTVGFEVGLDCRPARALTFLMVPVRDGTRGSYILVSLTPDQTATTVTLAVGSERQLGLAVGWANRLANPNAHNHVTWTD